MGMIAVVTVYGALIHARHLVLGSHTMSRDAIMTAIIDCAS